MHDLCPLCLKNGVKKKVKLLQINLQEAVQICEEEKCLWPFGYEDFVFYPRTVGKIWSCYWDDHKPRLKENATSSIKSSLSDTFITSVKDIPNKFINNLNTHCSENVNVITSLNVINSKTASNDLCNFTSEELSHTSHIKQNEERYNKDDSLNKEININDVNVNNNDLPSIDKNIESIKVESEDINSLNKDVEEEGDIFVQNIKNVNNTKGIPKIRSVEKTNIDISKMGNQSSLHQEPSKEFLDNNKTLDVTKIKEVEEFLNLGLAKTNETVKSNISITTMEIAGLPPITLSYEIPTCTLNSETVTFNTQQTGCKNNTKLNSPKIKSTFMKRNVTSGKQYEKFSFSAIKKKIESSNSINSNNDNNSLNIKGNPKIQKVGSASINDTKEKNNSRNSDYKQTVSNVDTTHVLNQLKSATCLSNQANVAANTETMNTSVNIDTVLEAFLTNDCTVSEDINDEWINSLLN